MNWLTKLPADLSRWPAAIEALDDGARGVLGPWLVREWIEGRLEPALNGTEQRKVREHLARAVSQLGGRDVLEVEVVVTSPDEETARRWCWIDPWILLSQDEDLFLMADELVAPLLEEAAAGCPKQAYARGIVAHHLRDQAHGKLRKGADELRQHLRALTVHIAAARRTGDAPLVAYLERLHGYESPQKVTRTAALQRATDLWRCHAPTSVAIEQVGEDWLAQISTRPDHEEWIVINGKTGRMRLDAPGLERAKNKRRR